VIASHRFAKFTLQFDGERLSLIEKGIGIKKETGFA
jgi:hypothetical protein